jgi:hypothetical protein
MKQFVEMLSSMIITSAKKKSKKRGYPSGKSIPSGLTPKAEAYWPEFWKKHGKAISQRGDAISQWKMALAIFRNSCLKRNIPPFKAASLDKDTAVALESRYKVAKERLRMRLKNVVRSLIREELVKKVYKEQFDNVRYDPELGGYVSTTYFIVDLNKGDSEEAQKLLRSMGFKRKGSTYVLPVETHKIEAKFSSKKPQVVFYSSAVFNKQITKYILRLKDDDLLDKKLVFNKLAKKVKQELKDYALAQKLFAGAAYLDFDNAASRISSEEQDALATVMQHIKEQGSSVIANTYTSSLISTLGSPFFQYALATALIALFTERGEKPMPVWEDIVKDPSFYLDPRERKLVEEQVETDEGSGM